MDPCINPALTLINFIPLLCFLFLVQCSLILANAPFAAPPYNGGIADGLILPSAPAPTPSGDNYIPDMLTLLSLKTSLEFYNPNVPLILYDWESGASGDLDFCHWTRVRCDNASNVIYLDFREAGFTGPLPQGFSSLPQLSRLFLSFNNFSGSIPSELGNCTHMQVLDLSVNSFSSEIPPQLGMLPNLWYLDLSSNSLTGLIDDQIFSSLGSLIYLNLSRNELYGAIPSALQNCSILRVLDLGHNYLNGSLPVPPLGQLPLLQELRLRGNKLTGEISSGLFDKCGTLQVLDLSENYLWGSIPAAIRNCSALQVLIFAKNSLSGSLPLELGGLLNLQSLFLGDNYFSGAVPVQLSFLKSLTYLDLKRNRLTGQIPLFLASNEALEYLWLHSNNLSGNFPSELLGLPHLRYLDLSDNSIVGTIPQQLPNATSLQFLFLSGNRITGSIPAELGNFTDLQMLDLSFNLLTGTIPSTIGDLGNLLWLMLANNMLTGSLPSEIVNCSSLLWLNLANNELSGPLPEDVGLLGNQAVVTFAENEMNLPPLPDYAGDCAPVQRWFPASYDPFNSYGSLVDDKRCGDFWSALIRGRLISTTKCPSSLNFTAFGYLQLSKNTLTGSIPSTLDSNFSLFSFLLLDHNRLTGNIPESIGGLPLLQLNFSHNFLDGSIGNWLANLTCLTNLDLSVNNLSGTIPAKLEDLKQLSEFNISYNLGLWGEIPRGGRFSSFSGWSYAGDMGLCVNTEGRSWENVSALWVPGVCKANTTFGSEKVDSVMKEVEIRAGVTTAAVAAVVVLVAVGVAKVRGRWHLDRRVHEGEGELLLGHWTDVVEPKGNVELEMFGEPAGRRSGLTYADLVWATGGFAEESVVGRGSGATVYKANLGGATTLAVKKLRSSGGATSTATEFVTEMRALGSLRHPHLVPVLGCLSQGAHHRLLLQGFMHNGSLHDWLYVHTHGAATLDWSRRLSIAHGAALGLRFLHDCCSPAVIHGNVKTTNILLDHRFRSHVADFGLNVNSPPDCKNPTLEDDVYSFGMVLLQLATRRKPITDQSTAGATHATNLVEWVRSMAAQRRLRHVVEFEVRRTCADLADVLRFVHIALDCTEDAHARPPMNVIAQALAELMSLENNRLPCIYASPA